MPWSKAVISLNLANATVICARAEEFVSEQREQFDVCTSRAVARLNILSELCLPFIKIGGSFIAMKAGRGSEEHFEALNGINALGAEYIARHDYTLLFNNEQIEREIYIYSKITKTPTQYPRKYAQILKKPL